LPAAGSDVDAAAISPSTGQGEPVIGITKAPDCLSELVMPSMEAHQGWKIMTATLGYVPEFTCTDVCDRCGRSATLRVIFPSGLDLLFCRSHAVQHRAVLHELDVELEQGPE